MPLVDREIRKEIESGSLVITPYLSDLINPSSIDVRLGRYITKTELLPGYTAIDPTNKNSFHDTTYKVDSHYILNPNEFILSSLEEYIKLPSYLCARLVGKSSLARLGLDNSSPAGWIDNGFPGIITVELKNLSKNPIKLTPGMLIGQLIFYRTEEPDVPYNLKSKSKYVDQKAGQGSKGV